MKVHISLIASCSLIFVSSAPQHVNAGVECLFSVFMFVCQFLQCNCVMVNWFCNFLVHLC